MKQKGKTFSSLQVIQKILNIILIILLFWGIGNSFIVLLFSSVVSNLIITVIGIFTEKEFWLQKYTNRYYLKVKDKELVQYGFPLVFTFLITWIFQSTDRLFIKYYQTYEELGIYTAAFSIIALLNAVQSAFTTFWIPVAYERYTQDPNNKYFFEKISKLISFIMLVIAVLMILFKDVLIYILGEEYRNASSIMPFLIFMPLMYTVSETTVLGIYFRKKSKYHLIIASVSAIFNIMGNLLLVPKYGAVGSAISTGLAYIIFFILRTAISKILYNNNYGLIKYFLGTAGLLIFALYASFKEVNLLYIMLGLANFVFICFLYYKDLLSFLPEKIRINIRSIKKNYVK